MPAATFTVSPAAAIAAALPIAQKGAAAVPEPGQAAAAAAS